jgi:hypothetical protein
VLARCVCLANPECGVLPRLDGERADDSAAKWAARFDRCCAAHRDLVATFAYPGKEMATRRIDRKVLIG